MRALYMAVDREHNDLPLFVSTSATEVADWAGVPVGNVLSAIMHTGTHIPIGKKDFCMKLP